MNTVVMHDCKQYAFEIGGNVKGRSLSVVTYCFDVCVQELTSLVDVQSVSTCMSLNSSH